VKLTPVASTGSTVANMRALLIACGAAFTITLIVLALTVTSAPRTPDAGASALSPAVGGRGSTAQRVERLQAAVRARPADVDTLVALGSALLQRVRETGDVSDYARAEHATAGAIAHDPSNAGAFTVRGVLRLARHDFRGALRDGRRARRLAPEAVSPLGVLVDANVELGRYGAARDALQRMIDDKPSLGSYARVSYFRELHGDLAGARQALALAVSASGEAPENVAYVQTLQGNLELSRGRRGAARQAYRAALMRAPRYVPARVGLARADAAAGHLGQAIERLRSVVARLPLPEYVVLLGETELAAGRGAAARRTFDLVHVQQRLLAGAGVNTDVELAIFEADHGDRKRALALARSAWRRAPSVRSADALGWALTRAGRPRQGVAWGRRALRLGSRDASFLYHAGMSARAAGERRLAARLLRRALSADPHFSALRAPQARRALKTL
jgi:tetratricopeptide (TPR) repeat protein